ncbi:hypothetical protein K439DRAFT_387033 [Ramaria rubella]|nr:hypothetical protein K439DRAFT_387033 [Ramaria rubella]
MSREPVLRLLTGSTRLSVEEWRRNGNTWNSGAKPYKPFPIGTGPEIKIFTRRYAHHGGRSPRFNTVVPLTSLRCTLVYSYGSALVAFSGMFGDLQIPVRQRIGHWPPKSKSRTMSPMRRQRNNKVRRAPNP